MPFHEDSGKDPLESDGFTTIDGDYYRQTRSGYERVPTEEVDTARIRQQAARSARRDAVLRMLVTRSDKMDASLETITNQLVEQKMASMNVATELKGLRDLLTNRIGQTESRTEEVNVKISEHLNDHKQQDAAGKNAWATLWPSIIVAAASAAAGALVVLVVGGG